MIDAYPASVKRPARIRKAFLIDFIHSHRTEIVLFLIAILIYLPGISWGLPYASEGSRIRGWATDTITPLGPLSELHNTLVEAKADRFLSYPLMQYLLLAAAYSPYLLYLFATGRWSNPGAVYPYGLSDPVGSLQTMEMIGKSVAMFMAAGIVVSVYLTIKTLWGKRAGVIAALFTMLLYPLSYYSRTGNLDIPVLFWTSLGLLIYARIIEFGFTPRRGLWLGVFAAFTASTKDQGGAAFALIPVVLLVLYVIRDRRAGISLFLKSSVASILAFSVAYALASGLALNPERHISHIKWIAYHSTLPVQEHVPPTIIGYSQLFFDMLGNVADAATILMIFAASIGILITMRKDPYKLALLAPAVGHFILVLMPLRLSLVRYALPITLITCFFAARAIAEGMRGARWMKIASWGTFLIICGWLLVLDTDLTYQMLNDSRYAAARWLDEHLEPSDSVSSVVPYVYLPKIEPGVVYNLLPAGSDAAEAISSNCPDIIIVMPDWTSEKGGVFPAQFPEEVYAQLQNGSLGYSLAARFKSPSVVQHQILDYPTVNPPVEVYSREGCESDQSSFSTNP